MHVCSGCVGMHCDSREESYLDSAVDSAEGLCSATDRSAVRIPAASVCLSVVKITAKWGFKSPPTLHTKEVKNGTLRAEKAIVRMISSSSRNVRQAVFSPGR